MLGLYADVEGFRHLLRAVLASVTMIPRSLERKYVPHHVPFESPSTQTASSSLTVSRLVGWMVDWLVWLVVIGGWRPQIILIIWGGT